MESSSSPEPQRLGGRRFPKHILVFVKVALALLLIFVLFYRGDIDTGSLRAATHRPGTVIAVGLMILITLPLAALRWSIILRVLDIPIPLMPLVHIQNIATFAGQFLLGTASADAVRGIYAWRALRGRSARIAVSILADRALALAALILLAALFMLLRWDKTWAVPQLAVLAFSLALALGAMSITAFAMLVAPSVLGRLQSLASGHPRISQLFLQIAEVALAFRRNLLAAFAAFAIALIGNMINITAITVLALSLQISDLGALDYMFATPLSLMANTLPLTPGGLGVGEVAFDQICHWLDTNRSEVGYASIFFAFRAVSMSVLFIGLVSFFIYRANAAHGTVP